MKTYWSECHPTRVKCDWCNEVKDDLYHIAEMFITEPICRECLEKEEIEEDESLTAEERNR